LGTALAVLACSSESTNAGSGGSSSGGNAGSSTTGGGGGTTGGSGGTATGGTGATGGASGSGGQSGSGGASGAAGSGGSAGATGGTGGSTGGTGGTGGTAGCGDGVCSSAEMLTWSCAGDCANWYYVTNATNPVDATSGNAPQTWRGDLTFKSTGSLSVSYTSTAGSPANGENHTYTLNSQLEIATDGATKGQMSPSLDFFAVGGTAAPVQLFGVRKGSGMSKNTIQGTYRIRGLLGKVSDKSLSGLSGTLIFNSNGCLMANSTGGGTLGAVTFVAASGTTGTGCATVDAAGKITLPHQETSGGSTVNVTYEGWIGSKGDVILLTRNLGSSFEPGVIIAVRERASGHAVGKVKGTYGVTHLVNLNSAYGTIILDGLGQVTGGTLNTLTSTGVAVTGGTYSMDGKGHFATTVVDTIVTGGVHHAGQASNFPSGGFAPILVTSNAATQGLSQPSKDPSLMVWVLRN